MVKCNCLNLIHFQLPEFSCSPPKPIKDRNSEHIVKEKSNTEKKKHNERENYLSL